MGPGDYPQPLPRRKKEGHKEEAYGLLACNRNVCSIVFYQIVLVSGPPRRRPDATGKVPSLGKRFRDGRGITCCLMEEGSLLLRLRADAQIVKHPEDGGGEHPCFHDSFPNVPSSLSTPPGKFP